MELVTERLLLHPVGDEDAEAIVKLAGDPQVAEMTCRIPHPLSTVAVRDWLESVTTWRERVFAILLKDRGIASRPALIGVIELRPAADPGIADVGYWLGVEFWRHGYMTEALRRVLRHAFGDLKLASVTAEVFVENARSVGVLVKSGFEVEGRAHRPAPARGGDREVLQFKATRASFAHAALSQAVGRA